MGVLAVLKWRVQRQASKVEFHCILLGRKLTMGSVSQIRRTEKLESKHGFSKAKFLAPMKLSTEIRLHKQQPDPERVRPARAEVENVSVMTTREGVAVRADGGSKVKSASNVIEESDGVKYT